MLEDLSNEGKRDEMKLNKKKTKIMCNGMARSRLRTGVMIDTEQLEEVTEYKYLGRLVTSGNKSGKEIGQRLRSGWRRLTDCSHFSKDRKIPIRRKRNIMDSVIFTSFDVWKRNRDSSKPSGEEGDITKRNKIHNAIIRSETGEKVIIERVQCMRGLWVSM